MYNNPFDIKLKGTYLLVLFLFSISSISVLICYNLNFPCHHVSSHNVTTQFWIHQTQLTSDVHTLDTNCLWYKNTEAIYFSSILKPVKIISAYNIKQA